MPLTIFAVSACVSICVSANAPFPRGAVAADHELASQAGAEILQAGGNAVDAAVATSFALSVVRPYSCGIGGGGFMVIHLSDKHAKGPLNTALNYREFSPKAATANTYVDDPDPKASEHGGKAVAIPGTVAGLLYALEKYGTMSRTKVLTPAIRLAEAGFAVDQHYQTSAKEVIADFAKNGTYPKRFLPLYSMYLRDGKVRAGDTVRVSRQAETFRRIERQGAKGFYQGEIGAAIVSAVQGDHGFLTQEDLDSFAVREMSPLTMELSEHRTVLTMPPPSSGGIALVQTLAVMDQLHSRLADSGGLGEQNSNRYVHLATETLTHAFADRSRFLNDLDCPTCPKVDVAALTDAGMLAARAKLISPETKTVHAKYGVQQKDDGGTSHFCVVDDQGNAVACTETINLVFGSLLMVEQFGIVLNNQMDDFTTQPGKPNAFGLTQSPRNAPAPLKRPLSSMTPTVILKDGRPEIVAGASGGPRIISGTIESILNVLYFDKSAEDAVGLPRFHHQYLPDKLEFETAWSDAARDEVMKKLGYTLGTTKAVGNVQLIRRSKGRDGFDAACDPRKGGKPAGN